MRMLKAVVLALCLASTSCNANAGSSFVVNLLPIPGGGYLAPNYLGNDENANRNSVYVDLRNVTKFRISTRGYEPTPPYLSYVSVMYSDNAGVTWECLGGSVNCNMAVLSGPPPGAPALAPSAVTAIPFRQRKEYALLRAVAMDPVENGPFITQFVVQFYY